MRPTKHFYTGVSLFLAMALCGPVVAEIEEITVTAQKREENVQDRANFRYDFSPMISLRNRTLTPSGIWRAMRLT